MNYSELKEILKARPFEPILLGLSDGRSVLIRHPDQVVVTRRTLFVGLAELGRSRPLSTPRAAAAIPKDWLWVNLVHVATVEPAEQNGRARSRRRG